MADLQSATLFWDCLHEPLSDTGKRFRRTVESPGITLSEFPTTIEAARRARELGLAVSMGAPNALRGKSSSANLSALRAIRAGIADILCADYYPAAMLWTVFKLAAQNRLELPRATQLVTLNPAKAVGLSETFGSLEPGKIADLIIVSLNRQRIPIVQSVFVDGEERVARHSLPGASAIAECSPG